MKKSPAHFTLLELYPAVFDNDFNVYEFSLVDVFSLADVDEKP